MFYDTRGVKYVKRCKKVWFYNAEPPCEEAVLNDSDDGV
jgi:hypothetical protein